MLANNMVFALIYISNKRGGPVWICFYKGPNALGLSSQARTLGLGLFFPLIFHFNFLIFYYIFSKNK